MCYQHFLYLEPTVSRLLSQKFQKDLSNRCKMRANLRLDVRIHLAYDVGLKSIFYIFLCKILFWLREGFIC